MSKELKYIDWDLAIVNLHSSNVNLEQILLPKTEMPGMEIQNRNPAMQEESLYKQLSQ